VPYSFQAGHDVQKKDGARGRTATLGCPRPSPTLVQGQTDLDPERLIFIDETGANFEMARLRCRAVRGGRCRAAIPHGHWKTTTFTADLRLSGLAAPMLLDGPMHGRAFKTYVEQVLVPEPTPGDIVVMDNLRAHKVVRICRAIKAADAQRLYLPPYSPDFAPKKYQNYFAPEGYDFE
jgi:hypothetical protein